MAHWCRRRRCCSPGIPRPADAAWPSARVSCSPSGIAPVAVQIVARSYAATGGFAVLLLILATGIAVALMAAAFLPGGRAAEPQAVPAE